MPRLFKVYHRRVSTQRVGGASRASVLSIIASRIGAFRAGAPRRTRGSQMMEFGSALSLLLVFIFIPSLDLVIVPIRWMMANELINNYVRTLAMSESHTQALRAIEADPSLRTRLQNIGGVQVSSTSLYLTITRLSDDTKSIDVRMPGTIPPVWLPDGKFAPCQYSLVVDVKASISPAVLLNWGAVPIPGLTKPIPISIVVLHDWGNLGKDPVNEKYYMNE